MFANFYRIALCCTLIAGIAPSVAAQKSNDVVRIPLLQSVSVISSYFNLSRENSAFFSRVVYNTLTYYDQGNADFGPLLAKSWKRVSPTVIEFELRDDVKFHNGNAFDADDVVYTLNWISEPNTKIQTPYTYSWIANAEKLSPYKVRVTAKKPFAADMLSLATQVSIVDAETHGKFTDKIDADRPPVGTGAFKIAKLDPNTGVYAVRNDAFSHGPNNLKAKAAAVHGIPMPDKDTQLANFLTGNIDLLPDANVDQIKEFGADKRFSVTSVPTLTMSILQFDTLNRSGAKELADARVRRALVMAIDRDAVVDILVPGGSYAKKMESLCFRDMLGCDYGVLPPSYDPVGAKQLLAEAGYPSGFDIELSAIASTLAPATAVAGYWRKIGVNAKIDLLSIPAYRRKQADGKLQTFFGERPYSMEDASMAVNVLVSSGVDSRTYWNDPILNRASENGGVEMDINKRRAIYREAFDRINDQAYILPFSSMPQTLIHSRDLEIVPSAVRPYDFNITVFKWK